MDQIPSIRAMRGESSERPQKRMRKGTRSCTECRRRKIRCKFLPGYDDCAQCSVRGSKCVSQGPTVEDDIREESFTFSPSTKKPASSSSPSRRTARTDDSDVEVTTAPLPPLVSMLDHSKSTPAGQSRNSRQQPKLCEALRSSLPGYDAIINTLSNNGAWWESFRQKTRVVTQAEPIEPLRTFAAQAYTSTSSAKLGILVIAYGRSLGSDRKAHKLFSLVDSLVISDLSVVTSLDGMECLVLLAKTYTDIGQPRRAWLMWRKGLATAELLGLPRTASSANDVRQRIWLAIYHGDRFTSLMLGLPHGFSDSHLLDTSIPTSGTFEGWVSQFVHDCAIVAGQVIESILSPSQPSFATAMQLDEKLSNMFSSAPATWWDLPNHVSGTPSERANLIDILLIHLFFFHVRLYAHLPFLKSESPSPSHSVSRSVCTDAARNMLRRFLILRTEVDGVSLFDCKTSDFVGFTAAVVLLIGTRGFGEYQPESEDELLLLQAERVFKSLEGTRCKVASQCRKALTLLSRQQHGGPSRLEVFIPYFGKVTRSQRPNSVERGGRATYAAPTPSVSSSTTVAPTMDHEVWDTDFSINYCGYQGQNMGMGAWWAGDGGVESHPEPFQGLDITSLDIDQDWSLFLNPM